MRGLDRTLLLGDAGALLTYSLGLSTARTLALVQPDFDAATDLASANLHLTVQYIEIEQLSATAITAAWCLAAALAGAMAPSWFAAARDIGTVRSLVRPGLISLPLAFSAKTLAVASVILPVGGSLAFDLGTAVADLGGMLVTILLWRTVLLQIFDDRPW